MTVAGNLATAVEIINNTELPRQLMFVGRDLLPVHAEGWVAVAGLEVTKYLVVSPVLLNDVDHVFDRVRPAAKG